MKILTYGGTNYYVADEVAWVMRFYHRLLIESRQSDLVDFPAHTDEIRNTIGMVELGVKTPYPSVADYPGDDEPEGTVMFRFYKDESISGLLNYMRDHIEGGFDLTGYPADVGQTIAEMEDCWVAYLKAEREREVGS
jgi:hypothetical protein